MVNGKEPPQKRDFSFFNKIIDKLIKKEEKPYDTKRGLITSYRSCGYKYSYDEIKRVNKDKDIISMREISKYYYSTNSSYQRIIDHFAYLYKYYYTLDLKGIKDVDKKDPLKVYYNSLNLLDNMNLPDLLGRISKKVLINGVFYGYVSKIGKDRIIITELNPNYCRCRNLSAYGTNIIEFNLNYFANYTDRKDLIDTLSKFPEEIQRVVLERGNVNGNYWVPLPAEMSCAFSLEGSECPPLFNSILDIINYDQYKEIEKERDEEELEKLLIQRFEPDDDGDLEFYLEEIAAMHDAAVGMVDTNKHLNVLTTLASEISLPDTKSSNRVGTDNLQKMLTPKYESSGLSYEVFASTGATSLERSLQNTTSFMSQLIEKYNAWLSMICYSSFSFGKIIPVVTILPITWYNEKDMIDKYLKAAQYGYSWILPYVALGKKQSTLLDTIYLEQDLLKLKDIMVPLSSSFTETESGSLSNEDSAKESEANGRPEKESSERSEQTNKNRERM